MSNGTDSNEGVRRGVDFASELIVPGGSNLVEGNIKQGAIHAVLGLVASSVFGLPGLLAVSANSFTKATTGRHLYEHLGLFQHASDKPPPAPSGDVPVGTTINRDTQRPHPPHARTDFAR